MYMLPSNYDTSAYDRLLRELTVERFGPTGLYTRPKKPVDDDLQVARRRRILNEALDPAELRGLRQVGGAA